jgi:hypothetical protein
MVKKRTFSSAKKQDDMESNVATTEDSEAYETVNTEDDTDNEGVVGLLGEAVVLSESL